MVMLMQEDPGLERRRALAQSMMQSGIDGGQPIKHWTQGAAKLAKAILGAKMSKDLQGQQKSQREEFQTNLMRAMQGEGGQFGPEQPLLDRLSNVPGIDQNQLAGMQLQNQMAMDLARAKQKQGGGIGTYNPRDYTTQSWTKYLESGNPADLEKDYKLGSTVYSSSGEAIVDPSVIAGGESTIVEAKKDAENKAKWKSNETKLYGKIESSKRNYSLLQKSIDRARNVIKDGMAAGYGAMLSSWPSSDAKKLKALLQTIGANTAFGSLQEMRDQSPTGGALGQVAVPELILLRDKLGSLEQANAPDEILLNLDDIEQSFGETIDLAEKMYAIDKRRYGSSIPEAPKQEPKKQLTDEELLRQYGG